MAPKERRERERQEMRQRVLDAARELFATEGYEAVTMRKIAERIDYSPTAIYVHFKDKLAVMQELCQHDFRTLAAELAQVAQLPDPVDRLRQSGRVYARFGVEHPNHYRLMFMTPHPPGHNEKGLEDRGNPDQDAYAFLRLLVEQALAAGRFRPEYQNPDAIAQALWSTVHGVVSLYITKCGDDWFEWRPFEELLALTDGALLAGMTLPAPTA